MSTIPPHSGHLVTEGYKSLAEDTPIELENERTLTFADSNQLTTESIANTGKISFSYQKSGAASKNLSFQIGKKTPLYAQIKNLPSTDSDEQKRAIKALVLKYVATLLDAYEIGHDGVKKVSAQFDSSNMILE